MRRIFASLVILFAVTAGTSHVAAQSGSQSSPNTPDRPPEERRPERPTGALVTDTGSILEIQTRLYNLNYDTAINGRITAETRKAISEWQENVKLPVTGEMTTDQLERLRSATVPTTWGALAYTARGAVGVVWNRPSRKEAEEDALRECRKRGGRDCKVIAAANKACGALGFYNGRVGRTRHWGAYASIRRDLNLARENALGTCQDNARRPNACEIRIEFCADGSHRR